MAVIAKSYAGVLLALDDMVGLTRRRGIADAAGQALDVAKMPTLCSC
jgi:hypothetical protein